MTVNTAGAEPASAAQGSVARMWTSGGSDAKVVDARPAVSMSTSTGTERRREMFVFIDKMYFDPNTNLDR